MAPAPEADLGDPAAAQFQPQCSCKAFKESGSCRHLPPALNLVEPSAAAAPKPSGGAAALRSPVAVRPTSGDAGDTVNQNSGRGDEPQLPELPLPLFEAQLRFGRELGRGAGCGAVFQCEVVPPAGFGWEPLLCAAKLLPIGTGAGMYEDNVEAFGREVVVMQGSSG